MEIIIVCLQIIVYTTLSLSVSVLKIIVQNFIYVVSMIKHEHTHHIYLYIQVLSILSLCHNHCSQCWEVYKSNMCFYFPIL